MEKKEFHFLPAVGQRMMTPPYMSRWMLFPFALLVITNVLLVFILQPDQYWVNYANAEFTQAWLYQMLIIHPLLLVGVSLAYFLLFALLLDGLSYIPAVLLWITLLFVHIGEFYAQFSNLLVQTSHLSPLVTDLVAMLIVLGFVGALAGGLNYSYPKADPARSERARSSGAWFSFKKASALFGGIWVSVLLLGLYASLTSANELRGWERVEPEHTPGPRIDAAVTYDYARQEAILFGGASLFTEAGWNVQGETWLWDGRDWRQALLSLEPQARRASDMAFDPVRQVVVLFGGQHGEDYLDDTWEWDGQAWRKVETQNHPSPRGNHHLIYDPQRQRIVLYGGYDGITFFNDTWAWDGQKWEVIESQTVPLEASGYFMFYDAQAEHIVAQFSYDTRWIWEGDDWRRSPTEEQPPVTTMDVAYDPILQRAVIFGGAVEGEYFNQTWIYTAGDWQRMHTPYQPPSRFGHASFYDPIRERVMVYGGYHNGTYREDMWELALP